MKKKIIAIIMGIMLVAFMVGCTQSSNSEPISRTEVIMGTVVKITLYDGGSEEILDKAFERIGEIEDLVSINKPGTEIVELNNNAGVKPVKLSDTSYEIISTALEYSEISQGGYDVTIGPLVKLWSIGLPEAKVPTQEEIDETITKVEYKNVELNPETKEVFLTEEGMMLDLGSIAKGYTADEVVDLLVEEGVTSAIVDLGGNIYALGSKQGNQDWTIGIRNPHNDEGDVVGAVNVTNKTVVTSGVYERYIEEDGVKYHHILNPDTGYPYDTNIYGVTIIADKSIDADALSTLVFTKGLDEGIELVESLEDVDAIFITNENDIYITEGVRGSFKIMDDEFKLSN